MPVSQPLDCSPSIWAPRRGLIPEQLLSPTHGGGRGRSGAPRSYLKHRKHLAAEEGHRVGGLPSQMLGLAVRLAGPRGGGRGGLGWRSCFLSDGEWILRTGRRGEGPGGLQGLGRGSWREGCILGWGQPFPSPTAVASASPGSVRQACHTSAPILSPSHCLQPQSFRK